MSKLEARVNDLEESIFQIADAMSGMAAAAAQQASLSSAIQNFLLEASDKLELDSDHAAKFLRHHFTRSMMEQLEAHGGLDSSFGAQVTSSPYFDLALLEEDIKLFPDSN